MPASSPHMFRLGSTTIDLVRREVVHSDRTVALTALENRILAHLAERAGAVVSRDELLREVWGYAAGVQTRAPHHAVTRIRKKVEADPARPVHLVSVYGEGYRLDAVDGIAEPTAVSEVSDGASPSAQVRDRPTTFIGRHNELARIDAWLQSSDRVLTVVGPGGAGKTRLCCRYASQHPDAFPGGSWLVELDGLTEPDQVAIAIAAAMGIQTSGTDHRTRLGAVLHARGQALLVLDDLQLDGRFLAEWLEAAPRLRWMITARRRLVVPSQQVLFLRTMQPTDALELLQARARLNVASADGSVPPARALEALIERLDGLPLALELAAARLRIMGVEGVLSRLEDRFRLLRSRDGAIDPRKADLRTVLESSWVHLDPQSRLGLAHCSVFHGAFSLEAAEAVIDLSGWPDGPGAWDVLEVLEDHSLLEVVGTTRARPRFRLLHSVRDLARSFLATPGAVVGPSGAEQTGPAAVASARARHAAHFARLGRPSALFRLQTVDGPEALKLLYRSLDEMVAALSWAVATGCVQHAPPLADAVLEVASNRGPPNLAEGTINELLGMPSLPIADAVRIAARRGRIRSNQGAWDAARGELEATLDRAREHGSLEDVARIREALGEVEIAAGNLTVARAHLEQTLGWDHHAGDASVGLLAMVGLGQISQMEGDIAEATSKFNTALQSTRRAGHKRMEAMLQCHIGSLDQERGRLARALQRYTQALEIAQEIGSHIVEMTARGNVAGVLVDLGRQEEAEQRFLENLTQCRELGIVRIEAISLGNLGTLYRARGELESAERAYLDSIALLERMRDPTVATIMRGNLAEVYRQVDRLAEASELIEQVLDAIEAGHAGWARGYFLGVAAEIWSQSGEAERAWGALSRGEALLREAGRLVDLGKLLCRRSSLLLDHGREADARGVLEEARQMARQVGASNDSELWVELQRLQVRFLAQSGPE